MQKYLLILFVFILSFSLTGMLVAQVPNLIVEIVGIPGEDVDLGNDIKNLAKGDVDGNGYTDIVVGSRKTEQIRVYFADEFGISSAPGFTIPVPEVAVGGFFGHAVEVGDLNGDGYDDIVTGAAWTTIESSGNAGHTFFYLGGDPMDTIPDLTIPSPHPFKNNSWFGYALAVGQFNTDNYADVFVSATRGSVWGMQPYQLPGFGYEGPDAETYNGIIYFYEGAETLDGDDDMYPIIGLSSSAQAGNRGMDFADVNGDGWDDLLLDEHGANWNSSNPMEYVGKVSMYLGGKYIDNVPDIIIPKQDSANAKLEFFGNSISTAGDVNGDGLDDLIVGTHSDHNNGGRVYLFYGPLRDLNADMIIMAPEEAGTEKNSWGTWGLGELGDINNDGYGDFLVSGFKENIEDGKAYIFLGGENIGGYLTIDGEAEAGGLFGVSSMALGDVNGDEIDDFLIGAPGVGTGGKLYIYAGSEDIQVGIHSPNTRATIATDYTLSQNYPNPFNPVTTIEFNLPKADHVTLKIYNSLGQQIKTLIDQRMVSGLHEVQWDGTDANGTKVGTGVYYYRIKTNGVEVAKKMTLLK